MPDFIGSYSAKEMRTRFHFDPKRLRQMRESGMVRTAKIGNRRFYIGPDIQKWIESQATIEVEQPKPQPTT